ncbi:MAG: M28 family peptidase [Gemmatimonadaceae bacterium]
MKFVPQPTSAAISERDLKSRIYQFADDSMGGRLSGSEGAMKGTAYIARELARLKLEPAGDNGSFFQDIPFGRQVIDSSSTLTIGDVVLRNGEDFAGVGPLGRGPLRGPLEVVYFGMGFDTTSLLTPEQVRGKMILLSPRTSNPDNLPQLLASTGYRAYETMLASAAVVGVITAQSRITPAITRMYLPPTGNVGVIPTSPTGSAMLLLNTRAAEALLGSTVANAVRGSAGRTSDADLRFTITRMPGRNVVAVLRGSDRRLRGQYVAMGAHTDHIGIRSKPVDHDSMRVSNGILRPEGAERAARRPNADEAARIRALTDSLHALHGERPDSIHNGADDDGSGSMGVLEIAEAFAHAKRRPARSLLFVWHMGEEQGMLGSRYFTDHPTVPLDSVVAQLNVDMIGRGASDDVTGRTKEDVEIRGRDSGYVQLIGSRRLSTELGDLVEAVNRDTRARLTLDYSLDANGHAGNIYCRSDHAMYARFGIPVTFFSTGGHRDYHQVTDEPQYLDFGHYRSVTQFIHDVAERVANLDHRPVVDGRRTDPTAACQQ